MDAPLYNRQHVGLASQLRPLVRAVALASLPPRGPAVDAGAMTTRAIAVGGFNATVSVEDVLLVARGAPCALDAALADKLDRDAAAIKPTQQEELLTSLAQLAVSDSTGVHLSADQARAVVFVKLVELATAKGVPRPALLRFLVHALNANCLPRLPASETDSPVLAALADAVCAGAGVTQSGEALATALSDASLQPPGLTAAERAALCSGSAPSVALAALAVARSRLVLPLADGVAALSCEALQSQVSGFDADVMDSCPHKHDVLVASELSALLEGSKCVNPRKGGSTPPAVAAVPHIHGRARDALHAAGMALRVELNAQRPGVAAAAQAGKAGPGPAGVGALNSGAVDASSSALLTALVAVKAASAARRAACAGDAAGDTACEALVGGAARLAGALAQCAAQPGSAPPSLALAHAVCAALPSLCDSLNSEMKEAAAKLEPAAAEAPSTDGAAAAKKGAGRPAMVLGKGTAVLRAFADRQGVLSVDDEQTVTLQSDIRAVVEANAARRKPKIPKGTRDFLPEQMAIRERAFASIVGVFKRHGAVPLDTPVFELRETLTGKYGEDSKLIYDLADQGGELLSLRYDLTVPFARYLAMHSVGNIKRYHIARVYRRDNPQAARGRYREFYQCDFDIAGTYPTMMPDAEVLKVMTELLSGVDIGAFAIKLNHRKLLDAALECAGVPASKFRTICSAVDKLDKEPWAEVRREMVEDKGLTEQQADAVGTFVQLRSQVGQPRDLLARLTGPDSPFGGHAGAGAALAEMGTLFEYLEAMGCLQYFSFDMSLARGLDYYTGAIYEAVLLDSGVNVGSIGGGGRYDNLVGMFSGKVIPAVGVSVGIERIFAILEDRTRAKSGGVIRATDTEVLVATIGPGLAPRRMAVASALWRAGVKAEFLFAAAPNMQKQLTHALEGVIPLVVIFGEDEINAGQVKIKRLADSLEMTVPHSELVERIRELLGAGAGETHVVVS